MGGFCVAAAIVGDRRLCDVGRRESLTDCDCLGICVCDWEALWVWSGKLDLEDALACLEFAGVVPAQFVVVVGEVRDGEGAARKLLLPEKSPPPLPPTNTPESLGPLDDALDGADIADRIELLVPGLYAPRVTGYCGISAGFLLRPSSTRPTAHPTPASPIIVAEAATYGEEKNIMLAKGSRGVRILDARSVIKRDVCLGLRWGHKLHSTRQSYA